MEKRCHLFVFHAATVIGHPLALRRAVLIYMQQALSVPLASLVSFNTRICN